MSLQNVKKCNQQKRRAAILEATPDFVGIADSAGKALYVNSAGCKAEKILKEGIPDAIKDGIWRGETLIVNREGTQIPVSQLIIAHRSPSKW